MSKENVVLFTKAVAKDPALNRRIAEAPRTADSWVAIAREAGFEFTGAEFAAVVSEVLGRTVLVTDAVGAYLGAQHGIGSSELSERAMERYVGGRGPAPGWILP